MSERPELDPPARDSAGPTETITTSSQEVSTERTTTPVNRTVWVMAAVAVLALVAGLVVGRFVISPAQAAAETEPPAAGPITIPVEMRSLSSDVVARGDAVYDDAVAVTLETGDLGGPAIVTGAVPQVGAEIEAGSVVLEITGRPVIALPGDLPVYRTLRVGVSGPDVEQLQAALTSLGLDPGSSGTYDEQTSAAVAELFTRAGYPAPQPPEGAREEVRAAEDGVRAAETGLEQAEAALRTASQGVSQSERISLDNAVNAAQRALDEARACAAGPADPDTGAPPMCAMSVADAQDGLALAQALRTEGLTGPDTAPEVAARDDASRALDQARQALATARLEAMTPLPASEVVYLANLPRRVDSVAVSRGSTVNGPIMTVSGTTLEVVATVPDADAALLSVGDEAVLDAGGELIPATIADLTKDHGSSSEGEGEGGSGSGSGATAGRTTVVLHPVELSEEQRSMLAGMNVRVTIPVSATEGEVLAVPTAALTAGPGGETRLEIKRPGVELPELVVVSTGLVAQGYAEITESESPLAAGDLVIVGQSDGSQSSGNQSGGSQTGDQGDGGDSETGA